MPTTRALPINETNSSTKTSTGSRPFHRRKASRLRGWFKTFFILAILGGLGYGGYYAVKNDIVNVKLGNNDPVYEPSANLPISKVIGSGYVDVRHGTTDLRPKIPGQITEILVEENVVVKKGTVLFTMDDTDAQFQVTLAKNAIEDAKQKLAQLEDTPDNMASEIKPQEEAIKASEAELDGLKVQLEEVKRLLKLSTPQAKKSSRDALESAIRAKEFQIEAQKELLVGMRKKEGDYKTNRAHMISQANHTISSLQVPLKRAEYFVEQHKVRAPYDGYVLEWRVNVGDAVTPVPPAPPALIYCSNERVIVRAEIDQEWNHLVKKGMLATIKDDARNDLTWKGKVTKVANWISKSQPMFTEPRQMNDIRTLECLVELLEDPKHPLRIGQRVRVQIDLKP